MTKVSNFPTLDKYLDDSDSKGNLNLLISQYNKQEFLPFVGAGISKPTGEPLWKKLVEQLVNELEIKDKMPRQKDGTYDYPSCYSIIRKNCSDDSTFFMKVFKLVEQTETLSTHCHTNLLNKFNALITTNFDNCFEMAYNSENNECPNSNIFCCTNMEHQITGIVYLHGHVSINYALLCQEDYDRFYPTISKVPGFPFLENFLEFVFLNKQLLFAGFSFDDKYIKQFLSFLQTTHKRTNKHFALISTERFSRGDSKKTSNIEMERKGFREELNGMGIRTIYYKQHVFIDKLLRSLSYPTPIGPATSDYPGETL